MKNTTIINKEIKKFVEKFEKLYGLTPQRIEFFNDELPKFAEKVFAKDFDIEKENGKFLEEYRDVKRLGGYNSTYGRLHHWLIDYAAALLGVDAYNYFYSKM